ncbi:N-acetylmuramidase family protein [Spirosoma sp. KUDC1026]|uniref:N-acetylmuramidase family protein n=1 Tax=Spirosoma sp. KUDC1026 TaxID=2745947 RepID=UPI00159B8E5D|nr:N-acetylmuramidase family protein [Spirosoma sp. KUDC1026]QKZ15173.1 N-acetylmuramidase family protein [Spirosoma sp. KUDC1026]
MSKPKLTAADFQRAATALGVDVATIRAVTAVESGGSGFLSDGRCVIRYEPHIFSKYTKGLYDKPYPELSYPRLKPGYPTSVNHSWELFKKAATLSPSAATMACSWGMFQLMGFHWTTCGCASISEFIRLMEESEGAQLDLFISFIRSMGLSDELRRKDWAGFARAYNGAGYKINRYDVKLSQAYNRYA